MSFTIWVVGGFIGHIVGIHTSSMLCHNVVGKWNGDMFCVEWTKVTGMSHLTRTNIFYKN